MPPWSLRFANGKLDEMEPIGLYNTSMTVVACNGTTRVEHNSGQRGRQGQNKARQMIIKRKKKIDTEKEYVYGFATIVSNSM